MAFTLPFGIRVAAGLLGTAIDRLGKLPGELPTLGVTLAGQLVKTSFRVRQDIAELATRGDDLLSGLTGGAQEHPAWATFDEDEDDEPAASVPARVVVDSSAHRDPAPPVGAVPTGAAESSSTYRADPARTPAAAVVTPRVTPKPPAATKPPAANLRAAAKPRAAAKSRVTASHGAAAATPAKSRRATRPAGAPDSAAAQPAESDSAAGQLRNGSVPHDGKAAGPTAGPIGSDHTFSISELKERLQELEISAVRDLLNQEAAGPNRAAYLTLLANRLTTLEHQNR